MKIISPGKYRSNLDWYVTTNVWFYEKNYPMVNSNTIYFYLINSVKILTVAQFLVQFYSS